MNASVPSLIAEPPPGVSYALFPGVVGQRFAAAVFGALNPKGLSGYPSQAVLVPEWLHTGSESPRLRWTAGADDAIARFLSSPNYDSVYVPRIGYPGYARHRCKNKRSYESVMGGIREALMEGESGNKVAIAICWPPVDIHETASLDHMIDSTCGKLDVLVDATHTSPLRESTQQAMSAHLSPRVRFVYSFSKWCGLAGVRLGLVVEHGLSDCTMAPCGQFPLNALQVATMHGLCTDQGLEWMQQAMSQCDRVKSALVERFCQAGSNFVDTGAETFIHVQLSTLPRNLRLEGKSIDSEFFRADVSEANAATCS